MIDGLFVFDNVIHVYDLSAGNVRTDRDDAMFSRDRILDYIRAQVRDPRSAPGGQRDFRWDRRWTAEEMHELVFRSSATDMAMAQTVPMFDWFEDWYSPVLTQHAMAAAYPDQVLFCGGVDPSYRGLADALQQIDCQAKELGARSFKFYNGHAYVKDCWRCDDEKIAYPMYERALANGVRVLQFHKGNPYGLQNMEWLSPTDLQAPARDFPQADFIVHHLALPYFEEMVSIATRFPNVYLSLAGFMAFYRVAPRRVQEHVGRLLQTAGPDKILWGSEAALAGNPQPYLEAFMQLQIPEDLRSGYGYPQITRDDRRKILGENFARIMGVDIEAAKRKLGLAAEAA
jgi:predicted TIM-barrel fold metal-dependent hydrolase